MTFDALRASLDVNVAMLPSMGYYVYMSKGEKIIIALLIFPVPS